MGSEMCIRDSYYDDWHHIAITTVNEGSDLEVRFYVDGSLVESKAALNQACASIPSPHIAQIGSLVTRHELDQLPLMFEVKASGNGYVFAPNGSIFRDHPIFGLFTENHKRADSSGLLNNAGTGARQVHDSTSIRVELTRVFDQPNGPIVETDDTPLTLWDNPAAYNNNTASVNGVQIPNFAQQVLDGAILFRAQLKTPEGIVLQTYLHPTGAADSTHSDLNTLSVLSPQGSGKLHASIDDFRFWKTKRTSRQIGKWYIQLNGIYN